MAQFVFTVEQDGQRTSGSIEAANRNNALKSLAEKNLVVIKLTEVETNREKIKISGEELLLFTQELGSMLKAGITFRYALEVLSLDLDNPQLRQISMEMTSGLKEGQSVSAVLRKYPRIFSKLYVSMVEAGETGGDLPGILLRLAKYIERVEELKKKVQSQLYYPLMVLLFSVAVISFILVFGIPRVNEVYQGFDAELPMPTQVFLGIGTFISTYWWIIFPVLFLVGYGIYRWSITSKGREFWDRWKINNRFIGSLFKKLSISRFARTLSTLYASGIPILDSMRLVAGSADNVIMENAIRESVERLKQGESITKALGARREIFTPMTISMIAAGEETGSLNTMLDELSDFYEMQVEISLKALTGLIEPIIMIFIGLFIAVLIIVMALPFMQLFTAIQ